MFKRIRGAMLAGVAATLTVFLPLQQADACTSFLIKSADGGFAYGRTLEFGLPLQSQLMIAPRHFDFKGTGPDGQAGTGLSWTSKYGVVGANAFGLPVFIDGMNEVGLAGGLLYFPGYAQFQDVPADQARSSIAPHELLTYLLSNFATIEEVKAGLPKIKVNRAVQAQLKITAPIHATLHDASGASIVVEYLDGKLNIFDNPTSVMTNAPSFEWHIANLSNYLQISPYNPASVKIGSLTLNSPSTGAGGLGLPGDMSSPSRFVRAFQYSRLAPVSPTSTDAVDTAFHILNNFDLPPGFVRTSSDAAVGGGVASIEITEFMSVADLKAKRYYMRTYSNSQSQMLDLSRADLDARQIKYFPVDRAAGVIDVLK